MDSYIIDLQKDIIKNKDIKSILNKALIISNELEIKELNEWINLELNGYKNIEQLPHYRILECEVKYDLIDQIGVNIVNASNIPLPHINDQIDNQIRKVEIFQSIWELINICDSHLDYFHVPIDSKTENLLRENKVKNAIKIYRVCSIFQLQTIFDHVKKEILDWCSELKKNNIIGESYIFTNEECEIAKTINIITPLIHIENTNIQINNVSYKENILKNLIDIKNILDENDVEEGLYNDINNNIVVIEEELNKKESNITVMKKSAQFMKDIINQVTIAVIADLLLSHVNEILNILSNI